jgi:hypothetical protein
MEMDMAFSDRYKSAWYADCMLEGQAASRLIQKAGSFGEYANGIVLATGFGSSLVEVALSPAVAAGSDSKPPIPQ